MIGLENAEILRPAYSVEYDCVNPQELGGYGNEHNFGGLELGKIKNLWLAGQINGTTGYEEAGVQGIYSGINASLRALENENLTDKFTLARDEALAGVLIDDITSVGLSEPYRIFTSRSEFRLITRPDNAYERLTNRVVAQYLTDEMKNEGIM